jgi:DNA-binding NtrC family response regulator
MADAMRKILLVENSSRDAERFRSLLEDNLIVEACETGQQAELFITTRGQDLAAIVILLEIPGPPFAFELLLRCRQVLPNVPVVITSNVLDATIAARAVALGAHDFLQKPLDATRVKSCLHALLSAQDPYMPVVEKLNQTILGESPALRATLKYVAKVIRHPESRVLLIGESGTGKELLAQAIHELGTDSDTHCVAVNISAIPKELIESEIFGHEKGAFTGAYNSHQGYLEEAGQGTLFLDEIGDLDLSLQVKLLRVIQEKKFRRLKGTKDIDFQARLVCATNRDLAQAVNEGTFRRDLYHRIAEVTIQVPPLRERADDVDLLLDHFLAYYSGNRQTRFARETLTILHGYHFPGNIRELENIVKAALISSDGEWILPRHLPLLSMSTFSLPDNHSANYKLPDVRQDRSMGSDEEGLTVAAPSQGHEKLFKELARLLSENWLEMPYKEVWKRCLHSFDRIYLSNLIERYHHNVSRATKAAGIDKNTFIQHWKDAELPAIRAEEEKVDE